MTERHGSVEQRGARLREGLHVWWDSTFGQGGFSRDCFIVSRARGRSWPLLCHSTGDVPDFRLAEQKHGSQEAVSSCSLYSLIKAPGSCRRIPSARSSTGEQTVSKSNSTRLE